VKRLLLAATVLMLTTPAHAFTVIPYAQCKVADPTGTPLNVRTEPTTKSMVVSQFENDLTVGVYEWKGQWAFVESWGDVQPGTGWVYAQYLARCRLTPPPDGG
jgi:uncharacterized protein YraI